MLNDITFTTNLLNEFVVIYFSKETENPAFAISRMLQLFTIEDFETPLGLGSSIVNVGISFE